jgi:hypothetical protein
MRTDYLDATTGDIQLKLDSRTACQRDCAREQMSINPIMADAESNTKSQQKQDRRPKNHPPCETVLQLIGNLFQPFALRRGAGLDSFPLGRRIFHQSLRGVIGVKHFSRDALADKFASPEWLDKVVAAIHRHLRNKNARKRARQAQSV